MSPKTMKVMKNMKAMKCGMQTKQTPLNVSSSVQWPFLWPSQMRSPWPSFCGSAFLRSRCLEWCTFWCGQHYCGGRCFALVVVFRGFFGCEPLSRKLRWRSFEQKRENVYSEMLPGEPSTIGSDMLTARLWGRSEGHKVCGEIQLAVAWNLVDPTWSSHTAQIGKEADSEQISSFTPSSQSIAVESSSARWSSCRTCRWKPCKYRCVAASFRKCVYTKGPTFSKEKVFKPRIGFSIVLLW